MTMATEYMIQTRVAALKRVEIGYFVRFEGSWEYLFVGEDKPPCEVGDAATIRIMLNGRQ